MRRWGLLVALLVSLGLNLGILITLGVTRGTNSGGPPESRDPRPYGPPDGQPEGGGPGERPPAFLQGQREFMQSLAEERWAVEELRRDLRRELLSEHPDRARVEELLPQLAERSAALERRFVDHVLELRRTLGPEEERRYLELLRRLPELRERPRPMPERERRRGGGGWRDRGRRD